MKQKQPIIVWFRQDLRLKDNPALNYAYQTGKSLIPIYIYDEKNVGKWKMGKASRWWLHHSLVSLDTSLRKKGSKLFLIKGDATEVLPKLVRQYHVYEVCWNRCYDPYARAKSEKIKKLIPKARTFNGLLLFEPWNMLNRQNTFFKVFTPFWKKCMDEKSLILPPLPEPSSKIPTFQISANSSLGLQPNSTGFKNTWDVGEKAAHQKLEFFLKNLLKDYDKKRDRPDLDVTSKLSPHLHFGEISPRQVYHAAKDMKNAIGFLREIGWREFCYSQLYYFPKLPEHPWKEEFTNFLWEGKASFLTKWQHGETGYPIVDAGMRQLKISGWMHNRVRMIVASFLVKDLFIHWTEGEKWFWENLVDADLANNAANWQWVAGCGFDSVPFFRIFNPLLQGVKFDPKGVYIKKWIHELADVPSKLIHNPLAYDSKLSYPAPIVNHAQARIHALNTFKKMQKTRVKHL